MRLRGDRLAPGGPGIDPRWSHGNKEGVGTAYSQDSKVWYTMFRGVLTEVYYPLIDHPQLRDLQFLLTDGSGRFFEERRHLETRIDRLSDHSLGYRVSNRDPGGRFSIEKEVIAAPHLPCVLARCRLVDARPAESPLRLHLLAAPHLDGTGYGNNAYVMELPGRELLVAEHNGTWLALGASVPYRSASVGYVGSSDGWSQVRATGEISSLYDRATDGNVALAGELAATPGQPFTVALAFGRGLAHAAATLLEALGRPFEEHERRFREQWDRAGRRLAPLHGAPQDGGRLRNASYSLLLAHEDKSFPGAFIASLSIPWGYARDDADRGGYHLVWTRDLVEVATGLLAAGDTVTPLRTLIYLLTIQSDDGGFPQNCWLDGTPYWRGLQLDEVAFPILLAYRLDRAGALSEVDPYPMVQAAARFLVEHGPATEQERWEEVGGYSPSTLAAVISALVGAGTLAGEHGDPASAELFVAYADFLEQHLEGWTVTRQGTAVPGVPVHYVRILPTDPADPTPVEDVDRARVALRNLPPGAGPTFPAREIVDGGFLELVRYGIRAADDPIVVASVRAVDHLLKVQTPFGLAWRRYPHDGYGDRDDGGPYDGWGVGRAWPLLTGERGHYELAAGRDARPYLKAMEGLAGHTALLPEQVWDQPDRPAIHEWLGKSTGAARPLAWAHAEYLKLVRSVHDGRVFDRLPEVEKHFRSARGRRPEEFWTAARQPSRVNGRARLWIVASEPFLLHYSTDDWASPVDEESRSLPAGLHVVALEGLPVGRTLRFTRRWTVSGRWEGADHAVELSDPRGA